MGMDVILDINGLDIHIYFILFNISKGTSDWINLFFLPPMASIPLPFYFMVVAAFFVGAVLALGFLVWDKVNLSARLMKSKWRVSSLEREVEKLRKQLGAETSRSSFLRKTQGCPTDAGKQSGESKSAASSALPEDVLAPDPDKA